MSSQGNKKPTYTKPVAVCAIVLFGGSILLSILMATRDMAPPRKYEVDMSGAVIGIDTTSKIPVLTKEEANYVETETEKINIENVPEPEPIVVPSTPPPTPKEEAQPNTTTTPDVKTPKIEPIE